MILTEQQEWDELVAQIPLDTPTRDAASKLALCRRSIGAGEACDRLGIEVGDVLAGAA